MERMEYFAGVYQDALQPVAVLDEALGIVFENAAFADLLRALGLREETAFFTEPLRRQAKECLAKQQGATIPLQYTFGGISLMLVPCRYEEKTYLALHPHREAGAIENESAMRLLRNSHDRLLTYLNEIYGSAQSMGLASSEGKRVGIGVRRILRMANHLYQALDRDGKLEYRVPVNISSFLRVYIENFNRVSERSVSLSPCLKELCGRMMPEDVETVLSTLLSNALRFGGEEILLSAAGTEEKVLITVWDSGDGVADPEHLFEWGYRTPDKKGRKGLGYSLPMAKLLLERQGGSLTYSRKNGGTAFEIALEREYLPADALGEWKAEPLENSLSQLRVELSDL